MRIDENRPTKSARLLSVVVTLLGTSTLAVAVWVIGSGFHPSIVERLQLRPFDVILSRLFDTGLIATILIWWPKSKPSIKLAGVLIVWLFAYLILYFAFLQGLQNPLKTVSQILYTLSFSGVGYVFGRAILRSGFKE